MLNRTWPAKGGEGTPGTNGAGYGGTSTTSLAIAIASKSFTTQAGLAYLAGSRVRASSAANTANYMEGVVSSYGGTTLVLAVDTIGGSGTQNDWNFSVAGNPGTDGIDGIDGIDGAPGPTIVVTGIQRGYELVYNAYQKVRLQKRENFAEKIYENQAEITTAYFELDLSVTQSLIEGGNIAASTFYHIYYSISGAEIKASANAPASSGFYTGNTDYIWVGVIYTDYAVGLATPLSVCGINQKSHLVLDYAGGSINSGSAGYVGLSYGTGVACVKGSKISVISKITASYDTSSNEIKTLLATSFGEYRYATIPAEVANKIVTVNNLHIYDIAANVGYVFGSYYVYYKGSDTLTIGGAGETTVVILRES